MNAIRSNQPAQTNAAASPTASGGARFNRADGHPRRGVPWYLALSIVILLAALIVRDAWQTRDWPLIHDPPLMHFIAQSILDGKVPYRDVLDMNFPGTYVVHIAVLKILGGDDRAWRIFDLGCLALICGLIAVFNRRCGAISALLGATYFASYHLTKGIYNAGQRDYFMLPFLLGAAIAMDAALRPRQISRWPAIVVGLLLGAAMSIKPFSGTLVIVYGAMLVVCRREAGDGGRWKAAAAMALSAMVVPAMLALWLWRIGALPSFIAVITQYLPLYTEVSGVNHAYLFARLWRSWRLFQVPAAGCALALAIALVRRSWSRHDAIMLANTGYGILHYLLQHRGWDYHMYPLALALIVYGASAIEPVIQSPRRSVQFAGVLLIALAAMRYPRFSTEDAWWQTAAKTDTARLAALQRYLAPRVRPGETIQCIDTTGGGINLLYRMHLAQPTRVMYDFHILAHNPANPFIAGLRSEMMRDLQRRPPQYILVYEAGWPAGGYERLDHFPELRDWIAGHYALDREMPGWCRVYVRR